MLTVYINECLFFSWAIFSFFFIVEIYYPNKVKWIRKVTLQVKFIAGQRIKTIQSLYKPYYLRKYYWFRRFNKLIKDSDLILLKCLRTSLMKPSSIVFRLVILSLSNLETKGSRNQSKYVFPGNFTFFKHGKASTISFLSRWTCEYLTLIGQVTPSLLLTVPS